ncbi:SAV_2336 N-terminal domain-related protein [Streptomyces collinus]|uniref:SAV_2336 N-terminal domain-related protein n=1 Tax=Streptomyces collinus TaxID=42684 RepID=UPI0036C8B2BD
MTEPSLAELIARLRSNGLPADDAQSLADALWLARWMGPSTPARPEGRPARDTGRQPPPPAGRRPSDPDDSDPLPLGLLLPSPAVDPPRHVPPAAVPEPGSLPGLLNLQRSLRALQRHRGGGAPSHFVLDERATAERSARTGLTMPVLAPVTRRTASLQLLFDSSSSMVAWEQVAEQMRQVLVHIGAFRDVRLHWLHESRDGRPVLAAGRAGDRPRPADDIVDPTGRRFTLVITDGAGPLWRSGAAQRLLHRLAAQSAPVAVLQPLPQRLWPRTALSPRPGELRRSGPGGGRCDFVPDEPSGPAREEGLYVPVLPLSPPALERWARWVSGTGPRGVRGAAARVLPDHQSAPRGPERFLAAQDRVRRFRSDASPTAQRLAAYLAAAPLVLPVMLAVHRAMLRSEAGPAPLAEVLLGGLLSHTNPAGTEGETWYDFAPGVRELLLERLAKDEAVLVLKLCSEYVERHFGRDPPNFAAMAAAQLSGTDAPPVAKYRPSTMGPRAARVPAPFAAVAAEVVRRFTTDRLRAAPVPDEQLAAARELLARYAREQDGRALWTAIQMLGAVTTGPPGPQVGEANVELAEALLALHRWNPDPTLLDEADQAAGRTLDLPAPTGPAEGRARLVRGLLRMSQARDREEAGDLRAAEDLLVSASVELDRAARRLTDRDALLSAVLERARALEQLAGLRADPSLLYEAAGSLRAMAGVQTLWAPRSADLPLQLGRVLLAIAGTTTGGKQAQQLAAEAVRELAAARELLSAEPDGPSRTADLLLDLAAAQERAGEDEDTVLLTLGEAEHALDYTADLRVRLALRTARMYRALSARRPEAYSTACDVLARAASHASAEDPELAPLLEEWGEMLLDPAETEERGRAAVDVLRGALRATNEDRPERARRLLLLGRALHARHRLTGDRTDLLEADRVLGRAVSRAYDPAVAARGRYEWGRVQSELARLLGDADLRRQAVEHLRRAAQEARETGDGPLAAEAQRAHEELSRQLRS